jgi:acetyl-CoA carboxylase biotin carboxylase subunit
MAVAKLLIANKGEIAVRIIRAAKELGIATVQVRSAADTDSLAVKLADETVKVGPPYAARFYLNIESILDEMVRDFINAAAAGSGSRLP